MENSQHTSSTRRRAPLVSPRTRELSAAIESIDHLDRPVLSAYLHDVHAALNTEVVGAYGVEPQGGHFAVKFLYFAGVELAQWDIQSGLNRWMRGRGLAPFAFYDPQYIDPRQRNAVVHITPAHRAEARPNTMPRFGHDHYAEHRVLLCDDTGELVAWFGLMQTEPLHAEQRATLGMLSASLRKRLSLERRLRHGEEAARALARLGCATQQRSPRRPSLEEQLRLARDKRHVSERECEVLALIVRAREGITNHEICTTLGIRKRTVEAHCSRLLDKLGAENRTQLTNRFWELTEDSLPAPSGKTRWRQ